MNKTNLGAEGLVCSLMLAFLISSCHCSSVQYLFSISLKVSSSWPETALIFNFSLMISSSSSSILRWSLVMFISAYSERESDSFSLMFSCLIWSWYFSSLLLALHHPLLSNLDSLLGPLELVLHHGEGTGKI